MTTPNNYNFPGAGFWLFVLTLAVIAIAVVQVLAYTSS